MNKIQLICMLHLLRFALISKHNPVLHRYIFTAYEKNLLVVLH